MTLQQSQIKIDKKFLKTDSMPRLIKYIENSIPPFVTKFSYGYSLHADSIQAEPTFIVKHIDLESGMATVIFNKGFEVPEEALSSYHLNFMKLDIGITAFVLIKDIEVVHQSLSIPVGKPYHRFEDLEHHHVIDAMSVISKDLPEYGFGKWVVALQTEKSKYFIYAIRTTCTYKQNKIEVPQFLVLEGEWQDLSGSPEDAVMMKHLHQIDDPDFFTARTYVFNRYFQDKNDYTSKCKSDDIVEVKVTVINAEVRHYNLEVSTILSKQKCLAVKLNGYNVKIANFDIATNEITLLVRNDMVLKDAIERAKKCNGGIAHVTPIFSLVDTGENISSGHAAYSDSAQLHSFVLVTEPLEEDSDENKRETLLDVLTKEK